MGVLFLVAVLVYVLYGLFTHEPKEEKEYRYSLVCNEEIIAEDELNIWAYNGSYSISTQEPKNHYNQTYTPEQGELCEVIEDEI